jgi:hypothetical protein
VRDLREELGKEVKQKGKEKKASTTGGMGNGTNSRKQIGRDPRRKEKKKKRGPASTDQLNTAS